MGVFFRNISKKHSLAYVNVPRGLCVYVAHTDRLRPTETHRMCYLHACTLYEDTFKKTGIKGKGTQV